MAVRATGKDPATYFPKLYGRTKSEAEVYKHLIDVYRLRVEDDFNYGGYMHGTHGNDAAGLLPDFRDFMTKAERNGLLPNWWNEEKRQACEEAVIGDPYSNIKAVIEKPDVQKEYGSPLMPMVFRTIADRV
jgi:mitochondrial splicing suppressor protein 51